MNNPYPVKGGMFMSTVVESTKTMNMACKAM